ncbi:hypothetical protein NA78x_003672 [Anatilimnocola sp. NA78]|uniref:hypothetical protein n=1 Tax=Anatilimnocola sp. NA78 TaxID=3415683 RepID=UPI003CE4F926
MKRIAFLLCALLLLVANTAEARRSRSNGNMNYAQPTYVAPVTTSVAKPVPAATVAKPAPAASTTQAVRATPVSASTTTTRAASTSLSTSTAQGVANIMASCGRVGHWGGNPGYEGCGMAGSPQAAYNSCCYANSGMATVDVGYAQGANGMWYCCRRYR